MRCESAECGNHLFNVTLSAPRLHAVFAKVLVGLGRMLRISLVTVKVEQYKENSTTLTTIATTFNNLKFRQGYRT